VTHFCTSASAQIQNLRATIGQLDKNSSHSEQEHQHQIVARLVESMAQVGSVYQEMEATRLRLIKQSDTRGFEREQLPTELPPSFGLLNPASDGPDSTMSPLPDVTDISADMAQEFAMENADLLDELNDNVDAVRAAESRMAEISKLLGLFSTKVAEQELEIERIHEAVIESQGNVEKGNEYLENAASRGVDFRIIMLAIIVGATLSLLFLHYITP
jgi:t-SNARE complex subunit (syntaxin)